MNQRRMATVVGTAALVAACMADVAQPATAVAEQERASQIIIETFAPKEPEFQKFDEILGLETVDISTGGSIEFLDAAFIEMSVKENAEIEAQAEMEAKKAEEKAWQARVQAKAQEWQKEIARQRAEAKRIAEAKRRARARARARRRARREAQKRKELNSIRNFYWNLTPESDMSRNLDISKKTFQEILEKLPYDDANVFKDNASVIWEISEKYGINEFLVVGIIAWESAWGTDPIAPNNFSSQRRSGSDYYSYSSVEEGIEVLARNLAVNYLSENGKYYNGKSLEAINTLYCETDDWSGGVCDCMKMVAREYLKTID